MAIEDGIISERGEIRAEFNASLIRLQIEETVAAINGKKKLSDRHCVGGRKRKGSGGAVRLTAMAAPTQPLTLHAACRGHPTAAAVSPTAPLRVGPLLSPPRSSVSLFIPLNTVLWLHE
jgi:hypothetical protein